MSKPTRTYVQLTDGLDRRKSTSFTVYGVTREEAEKLILKALGIQKRQRKAG